MRRFSSIRSGGYRTSAGRDSYTSFTYFNIFSLLIGDVADLLYVSQLALVAAHRTHNLLVVYIVDLLLGL